MIGNKLKMKSLPNRVNLFRKTWHDKDIVMLHACFQLLDDAIEQESIMELTDWTGKKRIYKKIQSLHKWWKKRLDKQRNDKLNELDRKQYEEDNKKLKELIDIRSYLWN